MAKKTVYVFIVLAFVAFVVGCGGEDTESLLGTWTSDGSAVMDGATTLSNNTVVLTKGAFTMTYTANSTPGSQAGTMSPETPVVDTLLTMVSTATSGYAPDPGTTWYCKFSNVTASTATLSYSSDNVNWYSLGTYTKN